MRALQQSLAEALKQLHAMRHVEGKRLLALVDGHLNEIERQKETDWGYDFWW
jgi:uncharacterized protein YicC (UPF0701 family)